MFEIICFGIISLNNFLFILYSFLFDDVTFIFVWFLYSNFKVFSFDFLIGLDFLDDWFDYWLLFGRFNFDDLHKIYEFKKRI